MDVTRRSLVNIFTIETLKYHCNYQLPFEAHFLGQFSREQKSNQIFFIDFQKQPPNQTACKPVKKCVSFIQHYKKCIELKPILLRHSLFNMKPTSILTLLVFLLGTFVHHLYILLLVDLIVCV